MSGILSSSRIQASASKHGMMSGGDNCPTVDICPDLILAGLAAAGAAAFFFIYQAITVKAGRRKRSFQNFITSHDFGHIIDFFIGGKF